MTRPVILFVDDEPDLLHVLRTATERSMEGYEVLAATSIEAAEEVIADLDATGTPLALVVVDHVLGGRTGLELLERVKRFYPDARTMMYTGQAPPHVEHRAREAGARVVWKPVGLKLLVGELQDMLS